MRHFISALLGSSLLAIAVSSGAQVAVEEASVEATEASDIAREIALEAVAISVGAEGSRTDGEEKLQQEVDKMALLAASLDTQIRAGADKSQTRPIYEELRKARLEALGLAMSGQAEISSEDAALFEQMIRDLGRYHEAN